MNARAKVAAVLGALCAGARPGGYELHAYLYTNARDAAPLFRRTPAQLRADLCRLSRGLGGDDVEAAAVVRRTLARWGLETPPPRHGAPPTTRPRVVDGPLSPPLSPPSSPAGAQRGVTRSVRARVYNRLPRAAYRAARATRQGVEPERLDAFDAVWRSLWPCGRATLAEAFAEWCEAHPAELLSIQVEAAERRTRRLLRDHARYEREERAAIEGGDDVAA